LQPQGFNPAGKPAGTRQELAGDPAGGSYQ
jgi:hypothetical protein